MPEKRLLTGGGGSSPQTSANTGSIISLQSQLATKVDSALFDAMIADNATDAELAAVANVANEGEKVVSRVRETDNTITVTAQNIATLVTRIESIAAPALPTPIDITGKADKTDLGAEQAARIAGDDALTAMLNALSSENLVVAATWDLPSRTMTITDRQGDTSQMVIPDDVVLLINDLVTGGLTEALTAEQGKVLKGLIDALRDDRDHLADLTVPVAGRENFYKQGEGPLTVPAWNTNPTEITNPAPASNKESFVVSIETATGFTSTFYGANNAGDKFIRQDAIEGGGSFVQQVVGDALIEDRGIFREIHGRFSGTGSGTHTFPDGGFGTGFDPIVSGTSMNNGNNIDIGSTSPTQFTYRQWDVETDQQAGNVMYFAKGLKP